MKKSPNMLQVVMKKSTSNMLQVVMFVLLSQCPLLQSETVWEDYIKLSVSGINTNNDAFGRSVDINERYLVVGKSFRIIYQEILIVNDICAYQVFPSWEFRAILSDNHQHSPVYISILQQIQMTIPGNLYSTPANSNIFQQMPIVSGKCQHSPAECSHSPADTGKCQQSMVCASSLWQMSAVSASYRHT